MTRSLFLTARSPFARKVQILLLEKGLPFELCLVELSARSPEFVSLSPLGKVPVLRDEDGTLVFDSTVIAEYLEDRYPAPALLGTGVHERLQHRAIEELADTVADQTIALFFGKNMGVDALEKASSLLDKALGELERRIAQRQAPQQFGLAQAAVRSAVDYMTFRLGHARLDAHPAIAGWLEPYARRASVMTAAAPHE